MTAMELDPVFLRALRLLHSRSKDSTVQLRTMLDDAIKHRKGLGPGPMGLSPQAPISPASPGQRNKMFESSKRDAEKRNLDRLKLELSELVVPSKRARMDSPGFSSKSHTPSPTPTPPGYRPGNSGGSGGNSSEAEEELDLDMNLEGLNDCTCSICNCFNQENGNKLMECHTCQNLYHQECHSPAVSNEEANDPRLVWNCSACNKNTPSIKPVKPLTSSGSKSSSGSLSSPKTSSTSSRSPAKSLSVKSSGISNYKSSSSTSRSFRSGSSSTTSNSSNSSNSNGNSSSIDKRLQMMKKKVAGRKIK